MRVLQPSDRSFEAMDSFIQSGGAAFSVSRYGYEYLKKAKGIDLNLITSTEKSGLVRFMRKFLGNEANNLVLQIRLILASRKSDIIYYASDRHPYLLATARLLGICRCQVLMVCHFTYNTSLVSGLLKQMALRLERYLVFRGIDQVLFLSQQILETTCEDYEVPEKHRQICYWGADLKYFSEKAERSLALPKEFYFSSGGAKRDFKCLIDAFRNLPYDLVLSCPKQDIKDNAPIPKNVHHYDFAAHGLDCFADLRKLYQDSKAVLIPIIEKNHVANGNSTFVEGLACGKPILISDTGNNFADVEEQGIGLKVELGDERSWREAIRLLEDDEETYRTMSSNASQFAKKFCHYAKFSQMIESTILKMTRAH